MACCYTPFISPVVKSFASYVPGLSIAEIREKYGLNRVIKFASNENPLGASPMVQAVLREKADQAFRYPQAGNPRLCAALGHEHGIDPARIITTNGSDECIDLLFRACAMPGVHNAVAFKPCFGIYSTQAKFAGVELRQAPLNEDFSFDFDKLANLCDDRTTLVFVTNPDNPSGYAVRKEAIAELAGRLPAQALLVVDEAYIDFARASEGGEEAFSALSLLKDHPNIAILRTFSKSRGLAGLRLGYAILPAELASCIWRVRLPFSVNCLAEEAGLAALADTGFRAKTLQVTETGRVQLEDGLRRQGWSVLKSQANFIMATFPGITDMTAVNEGLLQRGLIVRALKSYGLPTWLRITVGTEEENAILLQALAEILQGVKQEPPASAGRSPLNVLTLDGPAGVGKSTLAKAVAKKLGYAYLDTGAMFRSLALKLGADIVSLPDDTILARCRDITFSLQGSGADTVLLCNGVPVGQEIRTEEVGATASRIATHPVIRDVLRRCQREAAEHGPLVAEGRDMGTVVFPDAARKIFLDARPEIRALRRFKELEAKGMEADLALITAQIKERDHLDRTRAVAPLKPAEDAVIIDTSDKTIQDVQDAILTAAGVQ